ncbi:hypothetical protein JY96_21735 [Aquabacterium sp. NJ1]|nr:hypothetical protein JY96_21735 [Aquabacterium sp. NJ1]
MATSPVRVAIDGAQVKTGDRIHFELVSFMKELGWTTTQASGSWQATYMNKCIDGAIEIHSAPGQGDVTAALSNGHTLIAEAKKGPLSRSKASQEYPLMREAIGQLMTIENIPDKPFLSIAVPHSPKFAELAERWRRAPLISQAGIKILTVAQSGEVHGF